MGLESMLSINGGKGKFVSGLGGSPAMNVLILGGGTVGQAACPCCMPWAPGSP